MLPVKKAFRYFLFFLSGLLIFLLIYFICSFFLPCIKANTSIPIAKNGVEIYVQSNGVHTDIVMPVRTKHLNWNKVLPCSDFVNVDERYDYVAMGWGDKGFYLDTPTWDDLTAGTALNAAFGLGGTAMHVKYKFNAPKLSESCRKLVISEDQYLCLIGEVMSSFELKNGKPLLIAHDGYTQQDRFYEGKGKYSLFQTCNVWTGQTLRASGIKIGVWTPFQGGLMDHLE